MWLKENEILKNDKILKIDDILKNYDTLRIDNISKNFEQILTCANIWVHVWTCWNLRKWLNV